MEQQTVNLLDFIFINEITDLTLLSTSLLLVQRIVDFQKYVVMLFAEGTQMALFQINFGMKQFETTHVSVCT